MTVSKHFTAICSEKAAQNILRLPQDTVLLLFQDFFYKKTAPQQAMSSLITYETILC